MRLFEESREHSPIRGREIRFRIERGVWSEPVVDADLSEARVHSGLEAQQAASDLKARAFAHGSDIFLGQGESPDDTRLIAHEATHVVQQDGVARRNTEKSDEVEPALAMRSAPSLTGGDEVPAPARISRTSQPRVQRSWLGDAWGAVKGAVSSAVEFVADSLEAGIEWLKGKARDFVSRIPGYKLFTVVIAHDPITGAAVARSGRNFIEAGLDLIPNGRAYKRKLEQEGALGEAATWLDEQIALLKGIDGAAIISKLIQFWNSLKLSDVTNVRGVMSRLASIFEDPVQRVVRFAINVAGKLLEIVKRYVLSEAAKFVRDRTTAYPLLTVILAKDPITGEPVERNGMNLLRGFMSLTEDGQEQLRQMEESGALKKAADWIDKTVAKLDLSVETIVAMFQEAWSLLTIQNLLRPLETFGRLLRIFAAPAGRIVRFVWDVAVKVLTLINDALIARLVAFARTVPGYKLLTVIIGKDPFSGEAVERSVENIVHGFLQLIPGGEETFQDLKKTGAIQRASDRIEAALAALNFTAEYFIGLFTKFWNGLSLSDLAAPLEAFGRVVALFGDPIAKLFNFVFEVLRLVIEVVLELMKFPVKLIRNIITKSIQAVTDIKRDPIGFLKNLLRAVKEGFSLFFANIKKHLLAGVTGWLFGQMKDAGITPPPDLSFKSILALVMQILGITTEKVFAIIEEKIGKEKMDRLRAIGEKIAGVWSFVTDIIKGGPAALWEKIKSKISGLWDTVLDAVRNWVVTKIIQRVTAKLLSMLDPTGIMAVVNSFIAFFNAVQSFIRYLREMLEVVNSFVEGVAEIAKGSVTRAATFLEGALARALPVAIGFLANQVGLGDIGKKVGEMIQKVQGFVEEGIKWLVDKVLKLGKGLIGAVKGVAGKVKAWFSVKFKMQGKPHTLTIAERGGRPRVLMASSDAALLAAKIDTALNTTSISKKAKKGLTALKKEVLGLEVALKKAKKGSSAESSAKGKLVALKVTIEKFAADNGVTSLMPPKEITAEGEVGSYGSLKKHKGLSPDHQPQHGVMESVPLLKFRIGTKRPLPVFPPSTNTAGYSHSKGVALAIRPARHHATRTYGSDGTKTRKKTLDAITAPNKNELLINYSATTSINAARTDARTRVAKELSKALTADHKRIREIFRDAKWKVPKAKQDEVIGKLPSRGRFRRDRVHERTSSSRPRSTDRKCPSVFTASPTDRCVTRSPIAFAHTAWRSEMRWFTRRPLAVRETFGELL